jgi:hypothetical protein
MSERNDGFSNPEACYRDLLSCQSMGSRPVLLRSADGLEWVEIDLAEFSTSWIESIVDWRTMEFRDVSGGGGAGALADRSAVDFSGRSRWSMRTRSSTRSRRAR